MDFVDSMTPDIQLQYQCNNCDCFWLFEVGCTDPRNEQKIVPVSIKMFTRIS